MSSEGNKQVSWEDQQKINQFSLSINKRDRLAVELKKLQDEKEYLDDLSMEIELLDDEKVNYKVGDAFVLISQADASERVEKENEELDGQISELESQVEGLDSKLGDLKKQLYAKFGRDAINLER